MPVVRRLALLLTIEAAAVIVLGLGYGVAGLSDYGDLAPVALVTGSAVLTGVVLLLLARATRRGRGWVRGPVVTLNLFPLPVSVYLFEAGVWWVGVPVVLLAGGVLALCVGPGMRLPSRDGT